MTVIQFRKPVLGTLLPASAPVPPVGVFRVTQQFNDRDFYWNDGRTHQATDIGNRRCNDPIVAMADGRARRLQDNATDFGAPNNALGVEVVHWDDPKISTEYWHLNGWVDIPATGWVQVTAGRQIGILGSTGLGQICHCHIEVKRNGVKFDPEPLMFGGSIEVDDMQYPPGLKSAVVVTVGKGNNLRSAPNLQPSSIAVTLPRDENMGAMGPVPGEVWADKGNQWYWVGYAGEMYFVHTALATNPRLSGSIPGLGADCSTLEERIRLKDAHISKYPVG